jgi:hypothetical protein
MREKEIQNKLKKGERFYRRKETMQETERNVKGLRNNSVSVPYGMAWHLDSEN